MRLTLILVFAAVVGGSFSSVFIRQLLPEKTTAIPRIVEVRELLLMNEHNKVAASLASVGGHTVLSFFNENGKPDVQVGVDWPNESRFVTFSGRSGLSTMSLRSQYPHSQATLALGDDFLEGKAVLGAQLTDLRPPSSIPAVTDVGECGLRFNRFGQLSSAISVLVQPKGVNLKTGIWIERPSGPAWAAPP